MANWRLSEAALCEVRKRVNVPVLITGGTGFVGSHLAVELLKRGRFVILLARPKEGMEVWERVNHLLDWHGVGPVANLKVLDGEVTKHRLGLDDHVYQILCETVGEIWHCASETAFSESKRQQVEAVNVHGTANLLRLAEESRCYFFHHMSTAYATGKVNGLCREEHADQTEFHNVYEESKHRAERQVLDVCRRCGIRVSVYRPSIIIGHSATGRALIFNGLYVPIRAIDYLRRMMEKDLMLNGGRNAGKIGASWDCDGFLYMPLRVGQVENAALDLVPIDFVSEAAVTLMEHCLEGGVFHIVNRHATLIKTIIDVLPDLLHLRGVRPGREREFADCPHTALEERFQTYVKVYEPYMREERIFDSTQADAVLRQHGVTCPPVDPAMLLRCFEYSVAVNWGRDLFLPHVERTSTVTVN